MQNKIIFMQFMLFFNLSLLIFAEVDNFQVTKIIQWKEKNLIFDITRDIDLLSEYTPDLKYNIEKKLEEQLYSLVFNSLQDIRIDSRYALSDYLKNDRIINNKIDAGIGLCKKEYTQFLNTMKKFNARYSWPLYGVNGIISCFVNHKTANPIPVKLGFVAAKKYTGILIYISGEYKLYGEKVKGVFTPVFFPDFYDEDMNLFFSKAQCNPDFILKWGIVEYTDVLDNTKYTDRIGTDPLRTAPLKLFGKNASDLILSRDVVYQILSLAENRQLLNEGRILIVCDTL